MVSRREFLKIAGSRRRDHRCGRRPGRPGRRLRLQRDDYHHDCCRSGQHHDDRCPGDDYDRAGSNDHTASRQPSETGREIKIGAVSPITGALASFGGPDKWIVSYVLKAIGDGVVCGDGKKHPISITQLDTQSSPDRTSQVAQDLIFNTKVDMMVASSSPDTVNPAADQCEANGIPFLANFVPWQPFYFGPGRHPRPSPSRGRTCTTSEWKMPPQCRLGMWNQIQTNKVVRLSVPERRRRSGLGERHERAGAHL